jgi:hypothetical protein
MIACPGCRLGDRSERARWLYPRCLVPWFSLVFFHRREFGRLSVSVDLDESLLGPVFPALSSKEMADQARS